MPQEVDLDTVEDDVQDFESFEAVQALRSQEGQGAVEEEMAMLNEEEMYSRDRASVQAPSSQIPRSQNLAFIGRTMIFNKIIKVGVII